MLTAIPWKSHPPAAFYPPRPTNSRYQPTIFIMRQEYFYNRIVAPGFSFCMMVPSLNKSTYGFCGHKYRPTLRVALTGASLPTAPRFLWRHFSRAKTPQDFSARENRMMTRKRTPAYWRMSRTMTLSAPIFAAEKRVCPC